MKLTSASELKFIGGFFYIILTLRLIDSRCLFGADLSLDLGPNTKLESEDSGVAGHISSEVFYTLVEPEFFAVAGTEPECIPNTVLDLDLDPTQNGMTKVKKSKKSQKNEMTTFWKTMLLVTLKSKKTNFYVYVYPGPEFSHLGSKRSQIRICIKERKYF